MRRAFFLPPELGGILAAAETSNPALPTQFGLAGLIATPLISALVWYVRRSEARWEQQLQRLEQLLEQANARADRNDQRMWDYQERTAAALHANADLNREVLRAIDRGGLGGR